MLKFKPPVTATAESLAQGRHIEAASTARLAAESASAEELRELVKILADHVKAAPMARLAAKNASAEELRELVSILADQVQAIGDTRPRGRPRAGERTPAGQLAALRAALVGEAKHKLLALLICRDLVDGMPVGPWSLSLLLFFFRCGLEDAPTDMPADDLIRHRAERLAVDPALAQQLADALRPLAAAELKDWQLEPGRVKRQGFRAVYRRAVAKAYRHYGITKDITPRTLKDVTHDTSA
jgi:hypothetical protein